MNSFPDPAHVTPVPSAFSAGEAKPASGRRCFLKQAARAVLAGLATRGLAADPVLAPSVAGNRWGDCFLTNREEDLYPARIGSFTKALPHDESGLVSGPAYDVLLATLREGPEADFELIPLSGRFRLANPQAAYACLLEGFAPSLFQTPAPPSFASAGLAGEAVELYWQALLRDVPFAHYETSTAVGDACEELARLEVGAGDERAGKLTPGNLFRGLTAGDSVGPYISQFLLRDIPYGATKIPQRYRIPLAGDDHLVTYRDWLNCQRGYFSKEASPFSPQPLYLRDGRGLGEYVRRDFSFQAFLNATLILLGEAYPRKSFRAPFGSGHPYLESDTQTGFATFGAPHVLDLVTRVSNLALKASWREKWLIHRRLRPEEFAGHVHNHVTGRAEYPLHRTLLDSTVLARSREKFGSWLLPQAYPDGCPIHPAYPSGHAVISGACVTMLKALFDGTTVFAEPVEVAPDGNSLRPYHGPPLTVAGELDKLASNIAMGRNFAGIHWRTDATSGLQQGQDVAFHVLREQRRTSPEKSGAFKLNDFAGQPISI